MKIVKSLDQIIAKKIKALQKLEEKRIQVTVRLITFLLILFIPNY